jgi:hypothetical protein
MAKEVKIFGVELRLGVVIAAIIIGWILGMITVTSCSRVSMTDTFKVIKENYTNIVESLKNMDYRINAGIEFNKKPVKEGYENFTDTNEYSVFK